MSAASDHDEDEDGLRGPVGTRFGEALHAVANAKGFTADYPGLLAFSWVDQFWQGRKLDVRVSPIGASARTTGHRWITIRVSAGPLGVWVNPPEPYGDRFTGVGLPLTPNPPSARGTFTFEPALSFALWRFVQRLMPPGAATDRGTVEHWVALQARNDGFMWHIRARLLDASLLAESLDLLLHLARYAETNDAALSAMLGQAASVTRARSLQVTIAIGAFSVVVVSILIGVVMMMAC